MEILGQDLPGTSRGLERGPPGNQKVEKGHPEGATNELKKQDTNVSCFRTWKS